MEYLVRHNNRRFGIALAVSLTLHAAALAIRLSTPASSHRAQQPRESRLDVQLAPEQKTEPPVPLPPPTATAPPREPRPRVLTARPKPQAPPVWTQTQRDEMTQFLGELDNRPPLRGRELAQRALEMARTMAPAEQRDDELDEMRQKFANAHVEPFSIEMYFDALFRKMNRSAAMLPQEKRERGTHVAAVRVVVDRNGSVKNFRVLWAADQQAEIDYIKAVVDLAAPFPVFPEDIRNATDSIVLQICIVPGSGGGGDATFSRMSPGRACQAG